MKENELREILAQAIYDSKYSALTQGYKEFVDSALSQIIDLMIKNVNEETIIKAMPCEMDYLADYIPEC